MKRYFRFVIMIIMGTSYCQLSAAESSSETTQPSKLEASHYEQMYVDQTCSPEYQKPAGTVAQIKTALNAFLDNGETAAKTDVNDVETLVRLFQDQQYQLQCTQDLFNQIPLNLTQKINRDFSAGIQAIRRQHQSVEKINILLSQKQSADQLAADIQNLKHSATMFRRNVVHNMPQSSAIDFRMHFLGQSINFGSPSKTKASKRDALTTDKITNSKVSAFAEEVNTTLTKLEIYCKSLSWFRDNFCD